ncbi:UNVERIFIED_CONTAM: hypothetical protein Sangu_1026300 [Sesamum angustifolium]|uniref:Uncharacterized protein n=1 Tax=Sesamum angustifolium TaxID=2727405 RepID=A0AAW2NVS7_9LAMI
MMEKGNIFNVGEVFLWIGSSIILWQVGLLPVEGEFVCHDFVAERDALLLLQGHSRSMILDVLEAFLQVLQAFEPLRRDILLSLQGGSLACYDLRCRGRGYPLTFFFRAIYF